MNARIEGQVHALRPRDTARRGFGAPGAGATVAIVGGGFCGTLAAIRLLRGEARTGLATRIVLIDPQTPGRGLAYRSGPAHWLLNVPAERMSAFAEQPSDFLEWARARHPTVRGGDYLPRAWYGDYLTSRLWLARRDAGPGVSFEHRRARAVDLERTPGEWRLTLDDDSRIDARQVLLALGNSPPQGLRGLDEHEGAILDPWHGEWIERLPREPKILLVGTGLTMIDIALSVASARPQARMTALSRHGLLPRAHAATWPARHAAPFPARSALGSGSLHTRLRTLREFIAAWKGPEADWRAALQTVRQAMPDLWSTLPIAARAQFLRHLRAWWDVHRHRVPLQTLARIESLRTRGRLTVRAGRLLPMEGAGSEIRWRARGSDHAISEHFDVVVNVTGADADPRRSSSPLVRALLARGLAQADELGLGWQTDDAGRLISAGGVNAAGLYYVGPLLRARVWEATAVPELRAHVDAAVDSICSSLGSEPAARIVK